MNQNSFKILINNLIGLGLAVIAIVAFTAGLPFEFLILGAIISLPFLTLQIVQQSKWIWRFIFIGLLAFQIYSFKDPVIAESFDVSKHGYFLTLDQIESLNWLTPFAAGLCLTSFWISFINTMKKIKKTLPNKVYSQ